MLGRGASYAALIRDFRWNIPPRFNIATACIDRWAAAEPERPALVRRADGHTETVSYGTLRRDSERLAHALIRLGIGRGDRVAVLLPQAAETVVAHMAVYRLGGVVVPLAALFGEEALRVRVAASGAKAAITDAGGAAKLAALRGDAPGLGPLISVDGPNGAVLGWHDTLATVEAAPFPTADTGPDDPALMIFTSGTTGPPKGAVHGHRVLAGHLPGFSFTHDFAAGASHRFWTPSDWAWAGGLLNALLPSLYFGIPVVFGPFRRFQPEEALALMAETAVTNAFLPPTAIKMMRAAAEPRRHRLALRTIGAAGERLGSAAYDWAKDAVGIAINEFYGQTECNYVLGASAALGVTRAGAIGKPVPGHSVAVIDAEGRAVPSGEQGEIAICRPDPAMFLGYLDQPEATRDKFRGDWMLTGDRAVTDEDGYVHFVGRDDDIIISAGYRIGPSEIEDCLAAHPAVHLAAAVGKPDPLRTEIVKAYVALRPGHDATDALARDIQRFVRERLSAAEYPREIAFVEEVPLTTSGKVIRRGFREKAAREAGAVTGDGVA
ncbi:MAG: AMP-binding protein [Bauldia sp.]|nr:AMP-binding protein [Bauldia sp.]